MHGPFGCCIQYTSVEQALEDSGISIAPLERPRASNTHHMPPPPSILGARTRRAERIAKEAENASSSEKGRVGSVCPKRDVSRPEGVGESKNRHEGAGWGRCVQKGDTSQPKGDGQSKNGMIWGQKGRQVQKRGRMGPMHPKMGCVVSRRAGGESVHPN